MTSIARLPTIRNATQVAALSHLIGGKHPWMLPAGIDVDANFTGSDVVLVSTTKMIRRLQVAIYMSWTANTAYICGGARLAGGSLLGPGSSPDTQGTTGYVAWSRDTYHGYLYLFIDVWAFYVAGGWSNTLAIDVFGWPSGGGGQSDMPVEISAKTTANLSGSTILTQAAISPYYDGQGQLTWPQTPALARITVSRDGSYVFG